MSTVHQIDAYWPNGQGMFPLHFKRQKISHYACQKWQGPYRHFCFSDQKQANFRMWQLQSEIAFIDLTGIRPSSTAFNSFVSREHSHWSYRSNDLGFDHTRYWYAGQRKWLITTEPYHPHNCETVEKGCAMLQWPSIRMPWGSGFHFPYGETGTHLILISPGHKGVGLDTLNRIQASILSTPLMWNTNQRWRELTGSEGNPDRVELPYTETDE